MTSQKASPMKDPKTSLTLTRRIAARPAVVWEALTTSEGLSAWMGPDDGPVVVAETDPRVGAARALIAVARDRRWRNLRLLSSGESAFKRAFHAEDDEGQQEPVALVFHRHPDGTIRLFWASELVFAESDPGQDHRAAGTIEPFWNMLDLGPHGRGELSGQRQYDCCHRAVPRR